MVPSTRRKLVVTSVATAVLGVAGCSSSRSSPDDTSEENATGSKTERETHEDSPTGRESSESMNVVLANHEGTSYTVELKISKDGSTRFHDTVRVEPDASEVVTSYRESGLTLTAEGVEGTDDTAQTELVTGVGAATVDIYGGRIEVNYVGHSG